MDLVKDLTKRQREIFDYIGSYLRHHGYPPTVREIGKAVGLHSSSTVHAHLSKLESLGVLKRDPSKPRALEVMVQRAKKAVRPTGSMRTSRNGNWRSSTCAKGCRPGKRPSRRRAYDCARS